MLATMTHRRQAAATAEDPDVLDVVLWHEREIGLLLSAIDEHEQALAVELRPALAARRDEIARAGERLTSLREHEASRARVAALTASWSWRATAPARRLYEWYLAAASRAKGERP
jgi:hypothetical protein